MGIEFISLYQVLISYEEATANLGSVAFAVTISPGDLPGDRCDKIF